MRIPADLSENDLRFLLAYLGLMKDALIGELSEPTEAQALSQLNIRTGPAIWRTKDVDQSVMVNGYKGEKDGAHYVSVEGSESGIPLHEVEYGFACKMTRVSRFNSVYPFIDDITP